MSSQRWVRRLQVPLFPMTLLIGCAATVCTAPEIHAGSSNTAKLMIIPWDSPVGNVSLVSIDDRSIDAPVTKPKDSAHFTLEAGERTLVFLDHDTAESFTVTFLAQAKKKYLVMRNRANTTTEEEGRRILRFSQDMGVCVHEFTSAYADRPLVACPQIPNGFPRVTVAEDPATKSSVFHLSGRPLAAAESALLQFLPDSSYVLAIVGDDLEDPGIHYDYQGEYLRGERPLPRLSNILGVQELLDYGSFVAERAIRFRPGEYKLLCVYQKGRLESYTVSAPVEVSFTATAGGRFVFKGNIKGKFMKGSTWEPTIEPMD